MDKKFLDFELKDIIPLQKEVIALHNQNLDKGMSLEDNLKSMSDEQLFAYIFVSSYQYFRQANGCWQSKRDSGIQALENAKVQSIGSREEVIETFTKDWDTYNLV